MLLPPGSSGSGDSCWGSESFAPTFSSSCNNHTEFSRCASHCGCSPCTAGGAVRHHQGPGSPPPNSHPCTDMHKAAHCTPRFISTQTSLLGGQEVPRPLCHPHGQQAAKSPSHNASLPEEIPVAAISNYQHSDDESWQHHWENRWWQN